jgi:dienelactone hydrolase
MRRFLYILTVSLPAVSPAIARADSKADVKKLLSRVLLDTDQTLIETQKFSAGKIPPLPAATNVTDWEKAAKSIRTQTLLKTVYRGEASKWRDTPLKVEWLETIPGGPGYKVKKLRYEAVPGLWIPALLYEPENLAGKAPVFLNVNGHDPIGKAVDYKQMRCINQAKRGIIALNPEWFGMGQLRTDGYAHGRMNQIDLCGTSGLAPFYLSMKRGLDVLLTHEHADPTRVGVAGLSGGGWQTIVISALDTRVTLANPVAGYSSFITRGTEFSDLGDSEQTPVDLALTADYSHLTALMAPRPTLLTYNLNDNCCFKADHALPPLLAAGRPFFQLYGKNDNLRYHVNAEPGDHNFLKENREALYQMIGLHFFPDDKSFNPREIPSSEKEIKTTAECQVEVPEKNADFHSLALDLATSLPREPELPANSAAMTKFKTARRTKLAAILRRPTYSVPDAEAIGPETVGDVKAVFWKIKVGQDWTVPAVDLSRDGAKEGVLVFADGGRAAATDKIVSLLDAGKRVLAVDPFYFGESGLGKRAYLFGLLISSVGERPLGIQSGQVSAICRWWIEQNKFRQASIVAIGPRSSLYALVTAALDEVAISGVELNGSLGSLKEIIEQNHDVQSAPEQFTFGLLELVDIRQLVALVAPRPVMFPAAGDRVKQELEGLKAVYKILGKNFDPVE